MPSQKKEIKTKEGRGNDILFKHITLKGYPPDSESGSDTEIPQRDEVAGESIVEFLKRHNRSTDPDSGNLFKEGELSPTKRPTLWMVKCKSRKREKRLGRKITNRIVYHTEIGKTTGND